MTGTAADRAYAVIHALLVDGSYEPGTWLREEQLSQAAGVSRTPVREALRRLAADGFVEFQPNRGVQVVAFNRDDAAEIFELRALLESHAAARAASRISDADLSKLGDLADRMIDLANSSASTDVDAITELNSAFHELVIDASESTRLATMIGSLRKMPLVARTFHEYRPNELQRSVLHHRELVDAIASNDADWARSVMQSHILAARQVYLSE